MLPESRKNKRRDNSVKESKHRRMLNGGNYDRRSFSAVDLDDALAEVNDTEALLESRDVYLVTKKHDVTTNTGTLRFLQGVGFSPDNSRTIAMAYGARAVSLVSEWYMGEISKPHVVAMDSNELERLIVNHCRDVVFGNRSAGDTFTDNGLMDVGYEAGVQGLRSSTRTGYVTQTPGTRTALDISGGIRKKGEFLDPAYGSANFQEELIDEAQKNQTLFR